MQALDLYAEIEEYLDFQQEIEALYKAILTEVIQVEPKTLVDIGCGQGEFCNIVEHNGIKSLGVDLSYMQIKLAQTKFPNLSFKAIDIAKLSKTFDCATATFDVINYIPMNQLEEFFTHCGNLLNKNGYFIFDINSHFGFEEVAQGTLNIDQDDIFIAIDANFEDHKLYTDITVFKKNNGCYNKQTGTIEQFYHCNDLLKSTLNNAGFIIEKTLPFSLHSEEENDKLILVCKKI